MDDEKMTEKQGILAHSPDERVLLTYEAVALLPDRDEIHTFVNPAGILLGADWSRAQILELLKDTDCRELAGSLAADMGHGLVAWRDPGPVFIETRPADE